jgi:AraC-like DNA-binding protein
LRDFPMTETKQQHSEHEAQWIQAYREEFVERIAQASPKDGVIQPLSGLYLGRASSLLDSYGVLKPSFCVIAQGSKEILLGDTRYQYDPFHYLLATMELPSAGRVLEASEERPYLSLRLELPPSLVGSVMVEAGQISPPRSSDVRAINVSPLDVNLLDAAVRLVRLVASPNEAALLMPLITREIIYRLLMSQQGNRLRHLAMMGGYTPHITKAIQHIRQNFDQPLSIEELARELGISVSGLHHHFKAVTAMSPLQFQKQLRLQEARRLMMGEDADATTAAYRVGYNDVSHFNREYKSVFGVPPMRDVQRLRESSLTFPS